MNAFRRRLAVTIALAFTQVGCTGVMWDAACQTTVDADHIAGRATDATGRPAVAVEYRVSDRYGERSYVLVSLDASGRPAPPFATTAPTVTAELTNLSDGVPADQQAAILSAVRVVAPEPVKLAAAALSPAGRAMPYVGADRQLKVAAYRVAADSTMIAEPAIFVVPTSLRLTASQKGGTVFVLVPARLPRPQHAIVRAKVGATLLTPVTVILDILLVPAYPLLLVTGVVSR